MEGLYRPKGWQSQGLDSSFPSEFRSDALFPGLPGMVPNLNDLYDFCPERQVPGRVTLHEVSVQAPSPGYPQVNSCYQLPKVGLFSARSVPLEP